MYCHQTHTISLGQVYEEESYGMDQEENRTEGLTN